MSEIGEVWLSWHEDHDSPSGRRTVITRADPTTRITCELLQMLEDRGDAGEGLFVIKADNGTARYALQDYDRLTDTWTARRIGPSPVKETL